MWNCGLDCHEESIRICLLDPTGKRELESTVDTETTDLEALLGPYVKQGLRVALEASGVSFPIHDRMKALGCEVNVWPPKKLRVIAESKAKCDKNDARWLAELLRTGFHPMSVYIPNEREREIRNLLTIRQTIVRSRVRVLQSARSLMVKRGQKLPMKMFHTLKGWKKVCADATLSETNLFVLSEMHLTWLHLREREISLSDALDAISDSDERANILKSIPGVGSLTALWMLVGLGDAHRFNNSREISCYLGIVPSNSSSAKTRRHGHITKEGKPEVRSIWIQAANSFLLSKRSSGQLLRIWFMQLTKRRGRKIAIVALARKLMVIAWRLLKENREFRPEKQAVAA